MPAAPGSYSHAQEVVTPRRDRARARIVAGLLLLTALAVALGGLARGWPWVLAFALVYACAAALLVRKSRAGRGATSRPVLAFLDATRFSPAFHVAVERWARAAGDDPLADEVFLKRRRRELSETRPPNDERGVPAAVGEPPLHGPVARFWRWCVLDFCFGYGVRPGRAVHLFVLLWLLNWAVFLPPYSVERPLSFEVAAQENLGKARMLTEEHHRQAEEPNAPNPWPAGGGRPGDLDRWGAQRAFFLAMRLQVPPVELFVDAQWKPADRLMFAGGRRTGWPGLTYENYAAVMRALNLILVPIVIAGAAGFLKPRDRDGGG